MKHMSLMLIHGLIILSSVAAWGQAADADASPITGAPTLVEPKKGAVAGDVATKITTAAAKIKTNSGSDPGVSKYPEDQQACADKAETAEFICRENTNPDIVKALPLIQAGMATLSGGVNDACSKFAQAMDIANKALLAYQAGCSAAKALCQLKCSDAEKILKNGSTAATKACEGIPPTSDNIVKRENCNAALTEFNNAKDADLNASTRDSVAKHYAGCASYGAQLASAVVGAIGVINSMQQSNKCDKKTQVATPTPAATPVDCTIEVNRLNNQTCICKAAPRTPGCAGGLDNNLNANRADIMGASEMGGYTPGKVDGADAGVDGSTGDFLGGASSGDGRSSGPGAPVGGRGAGIDGGGAFGGAGSSAAQKSGSGLNTNILGGEGGGGGGGRGGYGGRSDDDKALRDYLPGGQKDPNGNQIAGHGGNKGITTPDGKSNWEKVRERYRENNSSLLGK